jgi:hypothetical protein
MALLFADTFFNPVNDGLIVGGLIAIFIVAIVRRNRSD